VPLTDGYLGFLHDDLMCRFPYCPRLFAKAGELIIMCKSNQLIMVAGSEVIGRVSYWNRHWSPTYLRYLKPSCGVLTTVTEDFARKIEGYTRLKRQTFWRLNLVAREKDYGDWKSNEFSGRAG
jgi:hypothetical protein